MFAAFELISLIILSSESTFTIIKGPYNASSKRPARQRSGFAGVAVCAARRNTLSARRQRLTG